MEPSALFTISLYTLVQFTSSTTSKVARTCYALHLLDIVTPLVEISALHWRSGQIQDIIRGRRGGGGGGVKNT